MTVGQPKTYANIPGRVSPGKWRGTRLAGKKTTQQDPGGVCYPAQGEPSTPSFPAFHLGQGANASQVPELTLEYGSVAMTTEAACWLPVNLFQQWHQPQWMCPQNYFSLRQ